MSWKTILKQSTLTVNDLSKRLKDETALYEQVEREIGEDETNLINLPEDERGDSQADIDDRKAKLAKADIKLSSDITKYIKNKPVYDANKLNLQKGRQKKQQTPAPTPAPEPPAPEPEPEPAADPVIDPPAPAPAPEPTPEPKKKGFGAIIFGTLFAAAAVLVGIEVSKRNNQN